MDKKNSLTSGITTVLFANIFNLGFSVLNSFLLPKFLSVETYAAIKTFQLYIGYVGILHLGYVDGMYIRNGGKELKKLNPGKLAQSISTLRSMELCITLLLIVSALFYRDITFIAFVFAVLPLNMTAYFQFLFSSVGEFTKYSLLIRGTTIATFVINMLLLFVLKTDNPVSFLVAYVVVDYMIWIFMEIQINKICCLPKLLFSFDLSELIQNIKNGILLTLGNLSSYIFTGMDRWFVKILLLTMDFAQYSFAVSIEHFINVTMTPVSITLYNYFCKDIDADEIKKIRSYIMIFSAFIISVAFPAKFILENFLEKYIEASKIIFFLFSAQIFYFPINCIYTNLYKAQKRQKKYFVQLVLAICTGFVFNIVCFLIMRNKEAMAIGTMLSALFWWLLCIFDFKEILYRIRDIIFMFLELIIFLICGIVFNSIVGCCIYVVSLILTAIIFEKKEIIDMIKFTLKLFQTC